MAKINRNITLLIQGTIEAKSEKDYDRQRWQLLVILENAGFSASIEDENDDEEEIEEVN